MPLYEKIASMKDLVSRILNDEIETLIDIAGPNHSEKVSELISYLLLHPNPKILQEGAVANLTNETLKNSAINISKLLYSEPQDLTARQLLRPIFGYELQTMHLIAGIRNITIILLEKILYELTTGSHYSQNPENYRKMQAEQNPDQEISDTTAYEYMIPEDPGALDLLIQNISPDERASQHSANLFREQTTRTTREENIRPQYRPATQALRTPRAPALPPPYATLFTQARNNNNRTIYQIRIITTPECANKLKQFLHKLHSSLNSSFSTRNRNRNKSSIINRKIHEFSLTNQSICKLEIESRTMQNLNIFAEPPTDTDLTILFHWNTRDTLAMRQNFRARQTNLPLALLCPTEHSNRNTRDGFLPYPEGFPQNIVQTFFERVVHRINQERVFRATETRAALTV